MNNRNFLRVVVLFLLFPLYVTVGKKNIRWNVMKKSPVNLGEAFIDDASKELILEFKDYVTARNSLWVSIFDFLDNRIYNKEVTIRAFSVVSVPILNNGHSLFIKY